MPARSRKNHEIPLAVAEEMLAADDRVHAGLVTLALRVQAARGASVSVRKLAGYDNARLRDLIGPGELNVHRCDNATTHGE